MTRDNHNLKTMIDDGKWHSYLVLSDGDIGRDLAFYVDDTDLWSLCLLELEQQTD